MKRENHNKIIQRKWRESYVVGHDCITYGDGKVTIAQSYNVYDPNTGDTETHWSPYCDTSVESMLSYYEDIWTEVDIFHGSFDFEGQRIVFGDGGMGNEGYVASITPENDLNWSLFFTNSNPIIRAEMQARTLICYGETGWIGKIDIDKLSDISVSHESYNDRN